MDQDFGQPCLKCSFFAAVSIPPLKLTVFFVLQVQDMPRLQHAPLAQDLQVVPLQPDKV